MYGASELAGAVNMKIWFTAPTSSGEQTDASHPKFNLDITFGILSLTKESTTVPNKIRSNSVDMGIRCRCCSSTNGLKTI